MEIISRLTAILLAVILLPLLIVIALISLTIQGLPIIFVQPRVGMNFKKFNIYKFRTIKNKGGSLSFLIVEIYYRFPNGVNFLEKLN